MAHLDIYFAQGKLGKVASAPNPLVPRIFLLAAYRMDENNRATFEPSELAAHLGCTPARAWRAIRDGMKLGIFGHTFNDTEVTLSKDYAVAAPCADAEDI